MSSVTVRAGVRSRRAFTLIELLVVIAIIAILAAILFPVFAKAREKARQSSCASNMKQMALGILQYSQDYDEKFPQAFDYAVWNSTAGNPVHWPLRIQPYLKSLEIFRCPSDTKGPVDESWQGKAMSYAANGWYRKDNYYWVASGNPDNGFPLMGVMATAGDGPGGGWLKRDSATQASIARPADTVMIAEKHNRNTTFWAGVCTATTPGNLIGGEYGDAGGWGDHNLPNGTKPAAAYPNGPDGAVSANHSEMANFAFVDGHVKAMKPARTNPDPVNRPDENMWDATRK